MKKFDFSFKKYNYYDDEVIEPKIIVKLRELFEIIVFKLKLFIDGLATDINNINDTNDIITNSKNQETQDSQNSKDNQTNNKIDNLQNVKKDNTFIKICKNIVYLFRRFWNNLKNKEYFLKSMAIFIYVIFILIFVLSFTIKMNNIANENNKFIADAKIVCTKIMSHHGVGKTERIDAQYGENLYRLTGLSFVRQMDFNNDDSPELLVAYDDNGIYYVEVWGYDGKDFINLYSDKANSNDAYISAGSSITLYHHNSKYYIGKLSEDEEGKMDLYSLNGNKFKKSKSCDYDIVKDIYAVKNKINSTDFETIKLSFISSVRAEKTIDITLSHIDEFGAEKIVKIEDEKTDAQKKAEAYYNIVEKYNNKYGKASYKSSLSQNYVDGLAVVDLIDFNADKNEELLLIYRYNKKVSSTNKEGDLILIEVPTYYMEVYCWNGTSAKLCYENEGLSGYQENSKNEIFYILQKDGDKTNICNNSYAYGEKSNRVWQATSRILSMNEENTFESSFTAVASCNYGYMKYKINDERVYRDEFNSKGYVVPYFCNNDNNYDSSKFTVTVLQTNSQSPNKIQSVVSNTESTIKKLNPDYKPD